MNLIEFEFEEFNFKGAAYPFTVDSFDKYVDETMRNGDDAAQGVLVRQVAEPGFEQVEKARRCFPLMAERICDLLCEVAGFAGDGAIFEEPLTGNTAPGVLGMAGLSADDAAGLRQKYSGDKLQLLVVRDGQRNKLFACAIRADEEALRLLRADRKKGYGKAARSAALACIVWSDTKAEEAFVQWPAIPAMVLAPHILQLGGSGATRRFRERR